MSAEESSAGAGASAAPPAPAGSGPGRAVTYKRYDPSIKNKRVSQLAGLNGDVGSGSGSPLSAASNGGAPARVLGAARPAVVAAAAPPLSSGVAPASLHSPRSSISSQDGTAYSVSPSGSSGVHMAMNAVNGSHINGNGNGNGDYFASMHSESTAPQLITRQKERERLHAAQLGATTPTSSTASSALHTPQLGPTYAYNGYAPQRGILDTVDSSSSVATTASATSSHASGASATSTSASTLGPLPHHSFSNTTQIDAVGREPQFSRSQSAMASLQPSASGSSGPSYSTFKPFVPPSAYVNAVPNSAASSPGVGSMGQNVASQLHLAFTRGLSGVNGVVNGTAPVRLPQSASHVANAMWNRLPPAIQMLKDETWDGSSIPGMQGWGNMPDTARSPTPPSNMRSQSTGSVMLGGEGERDSRPGSSSSSSIQGRQLSPQSLMQPAHPAPLPLAAQLRLDVANKQNNQAAQPTRPRAISSASSSIASRQKAPYKAGYQPKNGVWRTRTEEFMHARKGKNSVIGRGSMDLVDGATASKATLEEERLLRRLDKIIELHFPGLASKAGTAPAQTNGGMPRSESERSLADSSIAGSPKRQSGIRRTSDVFGRVMKGVSKVGSLGSGTDIKGAEQLIVKWQDDSEAQRCPICYAPFNLITRKHHCRLCGRVVCFLPPNLPTLPDGKPSEVPDAPLLPSRSQRCSTLVIYDRFSSPGVSTEKMQSALSMGTLREVDLGDTPHLHSSALSPRETDTFDVHTESRRLEELKRGVRVCRECLNTVLKRQKKIAPKRVENWMKLYQILNALQTDIEEALPALSELKMVTPATAQVVKAFNAARKSLLQNLASFDLIAKRIRDLPAVSPTGQPLDKAASSMLPSSQERLQLAIYNRAALYMGEKVAMIKGMGGLHVEPAPLPASNGHDKSSNGARGRKESMLSAKEEEERAARLAVLYEQEALVAGYLDDANARRQFEDAGALKSSLDDLRQEIQELLL